jgi:hypothetical protein
MNNALLPLTFVCNAINFWELTHNEVLIQLL